MAIFWQTRDFQYVVYDDPGYVYENHRVLRGLTWENVKWSFTTFTLSNWHPVSWLSYFIDVSLVGVDSGAQHVENMLMHLANTILLFFFLLKTTGRRWESAWVAALFAAHPLHVESVAWISERKDVLSTLFFLSALHAYARYAESPCKTAYGLVFFLFGLGLMTKPMLVTFPFLLLLMDYWPLERIGTAFYQKGNRRIFLRLLYEKVPFLALSLAACVVTYAAQSKSAVASDIALAVRAANALTAYAEYLIKTIYPVGLSVFYPYPASIVLWKVAAAAAVLLALAAIAVLTIKRQAWMAVGLLWYLGTLVPVIGIVQVGRQAMADRYFYIPSIGIFIIIAWGVGTLVRRHPPLGKAAIMSGSIFLAVLTSLSIRQTAVWENSVSLFQHALRVTADNDVAHTNLGVALARQGHIDEAVAHHLKALEIHPSSSRAWNNLGVGWADKKAFDQAIHCYEKAIQLEPGEVDFYNNLAAALSAKGEIDSSISVCLKALQIDPNHHAANNLLGLALLQKGRLKDALGRISLAYRINPMDASIKNNLLLATRLNRHINQTFDSLMAALKRNDGNGAFEKQAERILLRKRELVRALASYQKAISLQPGFDPVNLILSQLIDIPKINQAYVDLLPLILSAIQDDPHSACIAYHLACIHAIQKDDGEAAQWLFTSLANGLNDMETLKTDFHLARVLDSADYKTLLKQSQN